MSNFSPKLEDADEKQLYYWVNEVAHSIASLASDELSRRISSKLQKTIENFNQESSKQTEKMIRLTWWIVGLTVILVLGLATQIFLAVYKF